MGNMNPAASGQSPVDEIKNRLSIADVVSLYVKLEPAGKNLKAKSPFTNEKTPSFFVSPGKGLYHCFSTGKGGDMFTFVQEMEGVDFKGALKILADKAGISLVRYDGKAAQERDRLYEIMERATLFFEKKLEESPEALEYLKGRGVNDESIKSFRIGYVPLGWRNLYDVLRKDFSDKDILLAGLGKKTEKGIYDAFRDRIMFPICDSAGRTIAFSGRIFHDDGKSAKYVNSPDTPLFNKSDILFALDKAKNHIRKYDFTTLVEGQFDVLMLHQAGFKNTVGVSGTALSENIVGENDQVNNLGLIKRLSDNIILAFDADAAGAKAAKRSAGIALSFDMDVKVVDIPGAKDPADFIKEFGKDGWSKILREAKHIIEFVAQKIKDSSKDQRDLGRRLKEEVLPMVAELRSQMEKSFFIKRISEISDIPESVIWEDLEKIAVPAKEQPLIKENVPDQLPRREEIEKRLVGMYYATEDKNGIGKRISSIVGEKEFEALLEKYGGQKDMLVFDIETHGDAKYSAKSVEEMILSLEEEYLARMMAEAKDNIKKAEKLGIDEEAELNTKRYQELAKRHSEIKNSRHLNKY